MSESRPLLVVGAGIAGMTAALEAAEAGHEVVLVEKDPTVGGRVQGLYNYFPKLCPPSCGMELNIRRLERNPRIVLMTQTEVVAAEKTDDGYHVTLKTAPQYVNDRCTVCGACSEACSAKVRDPFNYEMMEVPAIRLPSANAYPRRFFVNRDALSEADEKAIVAACKYDAIDLDAAESTTSINVKSVVIATGWHPYPIENLKELGGGVHDNIVSNVQFERLASPTGPTQGKILKADGTTPKNVVFIQCAGSRDVNHLPYCSAVCCLASLKHATYVKEQLPDTEVTIFYIDRRTPGRNEDFLVKVAGMKGVKLIKGKVGKVEKSNGALVLRVEDTEAGKILNPSADMVVLATGMVPNGGLPFDLESDPDGFGLDMFDSGVFVAGVARRPDGVAISVRDATGAAAKACAAGRRA